MKIVVDAKAWSRIPDIKELFAHRDLFLTLQLVDMGLPLVVALNMVDEARSEGLAVDRDLLEDLLGVPVIESVAVEGRGIAEIRDALRDARPGHADQ